MRIGVGLSIPELATRGGRFSPASLFTSGVAGAWYDPSDYSTLFQDSAGTTPVTAVEQPVGLMLDKSQGLVLGSEIIVNGDFSGGSTGWTPQAGWSIASGKASGASTSTNLQTTAGGYTTGKWYVVTFTISDYVGGSVLAWIRGTYTGVFASSNGTFTRYIVAGSSSDLFLLTGSGFTGSIDNISVKELPGNHASQATAASRPVLRARYNLLTYSEQFDNAAYTKSSVTLTTNATTAPDGTTTAEKVLATAGNARHAVYPSGVTANGTCVASVYAKYDNHAFFQIGGSSGGFYANFNIQTGVVGTSGGARYISHAITNVGSGWYRLSVTYTNSSDGPWLQQVSSASDGLLPFWTAAGTESTFIWGAQVDNASSIGTYQRIAAATDYATAGFLPYLAGDGVDDQMVIPTAAISGATAITELHGAWRPTGFASSNGTIFGGIGTGTTNDHEPFSDNVLYYGFASTSRQDFGSLGTVTTPYILDATQTGTTLAAFKNNVQLSTTKTVALGIGTTPRLFLSNNATSYFYAGNLFGGVLIQKVLSASEMASLRSWMAAKSGVTL